MNFKFFENWFKITRGYCKDCSRSQQLSLQETLKVISKRTMTQYGQVGTLSFIELSEEEMEEETPPQVAQSID